MERFDEEVLKEALAVASLGLNSEENMKFAVESIETQSKRSVNKTVNQFNLIDSSWGTAKI